VCVFATKDLLVFLVIRKLAQKIVPAMVYAGMVLASASLASQVKIVPSLCVQMTARRMDNA
jgi:hypothetical protein